MIAPPNHGSALAPLGFAPAVWEHITDDARRTEARRLYGVLADGLSAAVDDLKPGSRLLRELNARPRNPKVRYTILLGVSAPLEVEDLARLRAAISDRGQRNRWIRFVGPRLQEWLADLDEVVDGKGDAQCR